MVIRAGFQTFEFQQALELPKPLTFNSSGDSLRWVKNLVSAQPELVSRFREYLTRYSNDPESFRLTDHQVLDRLAALLYSRRIVVVVRQERSSGQPNAKSQSPAPAFPLSERPVRGSSASSPPPASDPPTFYPNIEAAAQASALVAAAAEGKPFCPE